MQDDQFIFDEETKLTALIFRGVIDCDLYSARGVGAITMEVDAGIGWTTSHSQSNFAGTGGSFNFAKEHF